jgi:hypothetical protein
MSEKGCVEEIIDCISSLDISLISSTWRRYVDIRLHQVPLSVYLLSLNLMIFSAVPV